MYIKKLIQVYVSGYHRFEIYSNGMYYEVYKDGNFMCSCDNWGEVWDEIDNAIHT